MQQCLSPQVRLYSVAPKNAYDEAECHPSYFYEVGVGTHDVGNVGGTASPLPAVAVRVDSRPVWDSVPS